MKEGRILRGIEWKVGISFSWTGIIGRELCCCFSHSDSATCTPYPILLDNVISTPFYKIIKKIKFSNYFYFFG